ncbi:MAG: exodeoxyribonuclease VII small subunit [Paludibacteraceae bacterium]|nr:exodeoxyribonuclease VII small subunit [Paludibacteraceae bacterium]
MSYDEKIEKAEAIIAQLEASEAISLEEYKRLAAEATALLKQCKEELETQGLGSVTDTLL